MRILISAAIVPPDAATGRNDTDKDKLSNLDYFPFFQKPATAYLEAMAQKAHALTKKNFAT